MLYSDGRGVLEISCFLRRLVGAVYWPIPARTVGLNADERLNKVIRMPVATNSRVALSAIKAPAIAAESGFKPIAANMSKLIVRPVISGVVRCCSHVTIRTLV